MTAYGLSKLVKDHFKITEHKYLDTPTIGAGIFIVGKNKKNEDLIRSVAADLHKTSLPY
jgi:hypothetical protein